MVVRLYLRTCHALRLPSTYVANLSATLSSLQSTCPFSIVPSVIAFLCTVINCRLRRCSSESVMLRGGRVIRGRTVSLSDNVIGPPGDEDATCSAIIAATMDVAVFSRVLSASVGAFGT